MNNLKKIYNYGFWGSLIFDRSLWMIYLVSIGIPILKISMFQVFLNISMSFFEIPSGILADKLGAKKVIQLGHLLVIGYLSLMILNINSYTFLLAFILYGAGLSMISGADETIIYSTLKESSQEKLYQKFKGRYNAILIASVALSSLFGGVFQNISWKYVYIFSICTQLLSIIFIQLVSEGKKISSENLHNNFFYVNLISFIKDGKEFKVLILSIALLQGGFSVLYMYGQLLMSGNNLSPNMISSIFSVTSLITVFGSLCSYRLVSKFGGVKVILFCLTGAIACLIGIAYFKSLGIVISFISIYLLYEIWDTSLNALLHNLVPDNLRTSLVSICNSLVAVVMILTFPLIAYLAELNKLKYVYSIMGILLLTLAITVILIYDKINRNNQTTL